MEKITIKEAEASLMKEQYRFKIIIVGDSGVGKTNLLKRFVQNTYDEDTKATVGVEFFSNSYYINDKLIKIELWDTAGQERYKSITSAYYRGASGAIIVYDVTSKSSFKNVDKWFHEILEYASKNIKILMIGNKTDLKENIEISTEMSKDKGIELSIPVMETSAKNASNVKKAFYLLIKEIYQIYMGNINEENLNDSNNNNYNNILDSGIEIKKKKKGCC
jgi:Ras-related protein Rab-11A